MWKKKGGSTHTRIQVLDCALENITGILCPVRPAWELVNQRIGQVDIWEKEVLAPIRYHCFHFSRNMMMSLSTYRMPHCIASDLQGWDGKKGNQT